MVGISVDITELKHTQEALKEQIKKAEDALEDKTKFVGMVTHEIRDPTGNVMSMAWLLKKEYDTLKDLVYGQILNELGDKITPELSSKMAHAFKNILQYQHFIESESERLLATVKNLGDLNCLQRHGTRVQWVLRDISALIAEAIDKSPYQNRSKIEFDISIHPDIPERVELDEHNLCPALSFLIGNAIRFSEDKDRVKITVALNDKANVQRLAITIQDFGCGIPKAALKYLFGNVFDEEAKSREDIYRKPSVQLPQAKMRIEASGGTLAIKSAESQGTTVYITAPYRLVDGYSQKRAGTQKQIHPQPYILIIEDDFISQTVMKDYLLGFGYRVDVASTGAEAIEMALKNDYDVALLDIELNRFAVTSQRRDRFPNSAKIVRFEPVFFS